MERSARLLMVLGLGLDFLGACSSSKPPIPLDLPLAPGQARAGKTTRDSELIGGPVAYGRAGDVWKLYNARARFLIQDIGTSVGLDVYGGNLIDADLVHEGDDGKNGNDLFRETFPIVGLRVQEPSRIEVISDGTRGGAAQLRVYGTDAPSLILPQLDDIGQELGGEITTDYVLDPDVPYLKIVTTYHSTEQNLGALLLGDFLSFGAALTLISPENGFTGDKSQVSFIGSVGDRACYGYVYEGGGVQVPLVDASGTVTMLKSEAVAQGGSTSVIRYLVVGGGDAASVMGPMYALRHIPTVHLSGTVRDQGGAPVPGARVNLLRAPYGKDSTPIDQARAGADGGYGFDAPPGAYVLVATAVGRLRGAATPVTVESAVHKDVAIGGAGQALLDIGEIVGGARRNAPAKVSFVGATVEAPDPRFGPDPTEDERNGVHAVALSPDGRGAVPLKPGTYDVVISRGVEYEPVRMAGLAVPTGAMVPIQADLRRVVDTTGWVSGDFHQHSQGSIDSPVPIEKRVAEDLAEGVEYPAATDHDNIIDYRPAIARLHGGPWMNALPGDEVSVNGVGHFNAYPLSVDPQDPYAKIGAKLWARDTIEGLARKLRRAEPSDIVVHISHPRTRSLAGYFNSVHFDPVSGQASAPLDLFDALEVNGDLGQPGDYLPANDAELQRRAKMNQPSGIPTMRDWFALLNQGHAPCALGNSDTHQRNGGTGYPRNFLFVGADDPGAVTPAQIVAAIRGQQVSVSHGPFVTVTLDGQGGLGKAQAKNLRGAASATLGVKVQAPSFVAVSTLEVYENGRPLPLRRTGPGAYEQAEAGAPDAALAAPITAADGTGDVVRLDGKVTVKPARDAWYVAVVRGGGSLLPVSGGAPYAYTNPIYADKEGDGWTAPGL